MKPKSPAPRGTPCDWCRRPSVRLRRFLLTPNGRVVAPKDLCPRCYELWEARVNEAARARRAQREWNEDLLWMLATLRFKPQRPS